MKNHLPCLACCLLVAVMALSSCSKSGDETPARDPATEVPEAILARIKAKGFSTENVRKRGDAYLVENDMLLRPADLQSDEKPGSLIIARTEQYSTNQLIRRLPRAISVKVSGLGSAYVWGTDLAISRYNRLFLNVFFFRVPFGKADITIRGIHEGPSGGFILLGAAGFPYKGNPFDTILLNTHEYAYGENPDYKFVGSVIQHELGHCIGMRHTDYMDRSFSCKGSPPYNEGEAGIGAVHIDGTPARPDATSWMLSCSDGTNRTFNANDIIALRYLYD